MSRFWRNWITGWCWAIAVFGAALAAGAFEATSGPARLFFEILDGPAALDMHAHMRFSLAVLGAVTIGWSLTLHAAVQAANLLGDRGRPIWVVVTASLAVWYVIDTVLSVATGFALNAIPNTVFLAVFLFPIVLSGVLGAPEPSPRSAV